MKTTATVALILASTAPAAAQTSGFCVDLERITKAGENAFVEWREPAQDGRMEELRQLSSTFRLAGAERCEIDAYAGRHPEFSCQWMYTSFDAAAAKELELVGELRECLSGNEMKERVRVGTTSSGGRVSTLNLDLGWLLPRYMVKRQELPNGRTGVFLKVQVKLRSDEQVDP